MWRYSWPEFELIQHYPNTHDKHPSTLGKGSREHWYYIRGRRWHEGKTGSGQALQDQLEHADNPDEDLRRSSPTLRKNGFRLQQEIERRKLGE